MKPQTANGVTMRKGNLVRLNIAKCFTTKAGGALRFPLTNYGCDLAGIVEGTRLATEEDVERWRNSDAANGLDGAGETKLPPTAFSVSVKADRVYTLLRARCRPVWSYRQHPGMALLLDTETGREIYVKRDLLEVA
ncbi:MAG TPA: hypothetical protein EYQ00_12150 [Dehalococcoidia bacterium]|nr:hypothetical protein [Dehalococcoidia bacterium]